MSALPWLTSIWFKPKATFEKILQEERKTYFWLLVFFYGFSLAMNLSQRFLVGYRLNIFVLLLAILILAIPLGYFFFAVTSWFIAKVGRGLGGKGNTSQILTVAAFSSVPKAFNSILWIILVLYLGSDLFKDFPANSIHTPFGMGFVGSILIAKLILDVWSFIIYLNGLCVAHQFSMILAILNVIIVGLIFFAAFVVLWMFVVSLCSQFFEMPFITFMK